MDTDLVGLLADAGIRPKSLRPGSSSKMVCPRCGGGRTREASLSVSIDEDGKGAVWKCHRSKCVWQASGRTDDTTIPMVRDRPVRRPDDNHGLIQIQPDWLYEWFAKRRIGARTVNELGIYALASRRFAKAGNVPAIVFPYRWQDELMNRKYRAFADVKDMAQEADAQHTLYNVDRIGEEPEEIIFCEGEMDVAALYECGYRNAVTLKDGAPAEAKFNPDDRRFEALRTHADLLAKPKRFILAGDMDPPGLALREELARRLGRHRCRIVDWPMGCKDAGETLVERGPEGVDAAMQASEAYPIEGLRSAFSGSLMAMRDLPPPPVMTTGSEATDEILSLPADGRLIIVTGWPSAGKSSWMRFIMLHTMENHDRRWAVFSPEMQPWQEYIASCAEVFIGKPFREIFGRERMSEIETQRAERWLTNRVVMILNDAEDEAPTLDWVLDHAKMAVLRDGVTDVFLDPWNELDHQRGNMTETDYIGRSLQRGRAFCGRYGCNLWIAVHPVKPLPLKPGDGRRPPPGPYDISGCYSEDTEVLTARGWVLHQDIDIEEDEVCCFDPTSGALRYDRATVRHAYDYQGPMHHYLGYSLDLMVTPNHRMLLQARWDLPGCKAGNEHLGRNGIWSHEGWQFASSDSLKHQSYRMPLSAALTEDRKTSTNDLVPGTASQEHAWAFIGWFVAEGWTAMAAPSVCQADENKADIRAALVGLGVRFSENVHLDARAQNKPMWVARVRRRGHEEFCDWIIDNCGEGARNKHLPSCTWGLPTYLKKILFDALIAGDGHQRPHNPKLVKQGGCMYATTSPRLANEVQRLAIELGRYATVRSTPGAQPNHRTRFHLTIGHPDRTERCILIPRNRAEVDYAGKVYCLTVPTGAYITRRNGVMAICGNSSNWFNKTDVGITVDSPVAGAADIHLWKARFRRWGKRNSTGTLEYDDQTGRYRTPPPL